MRALSERSQSETVGIVLLTAVIVVVTTTAGLFILSDTDQQREGESLADIEITPTASGIEIEHRGGDRFNASRISVLVSSSSGEQEFVLAEDFAPVDGGSRAFTPGQRWEQSTGDRYSGEVQIRVVDIEGGQILEQTTAAVGRTGLELDVAETTIGDEGSTNYTVTEFFEQDDPEDVTDNATVSVRNETVLTVNETTAELVGNNTGTTTVTAELDGERSNTVEVEVVESGSLQVSSFTHDNPVALGETLNITITVANPGGTEASGTVELQRRRGPPARAGLNTTGLSEELTLASGETAAVEFEYEIKRNDSLIDTLRLQAITDDDPQGVGDNIKTVFPVEIDDLSLDSPRAIVGEQFTGSVNVTNNGSEPIDAPVTFGLGDEQREESVNLTAGETKQVPLSVTPTMPGELNLSASVPDDSERQVVDVFDPASFEVDIRSVDELFFVDRLEITAAVNNTGEIRDTQTISAELLEVDGLSLLNRQQELTLDGGTNGTVTFTTSGTGTGVVEIRSEDSSDRKRVSGSVLAPETVTAGERVRLDVSVSTIFFDRTVELFVGDTTGEPVDSRTVPSGTTTTATLEWATEPSDVGERTLIVVEERVLLPDEQTEVTVTVVEP